MRTLVFGRMVVHKGRLFERGPYVLVKWSCANKRYKTNEDPNFWLNGRVQKNNK